VFFLSCTAEKYLPHTADRLPCTPARHSCALHAQEDQRLCEVMQQERGGCKQPGFSWSQVARKLGGRRSGKSCRLRWCGLGPGQDSWGRACRPVCAGAAPSCSGARCNQLSPDVRKAAFSAEEDKVILKVCSRPCGHLVGARLPDPSRPPWCCTHGEFPEWYVLVQRRGMRTAGPSGVRQPLGLDCQAPARQVRHTLPPLPRTPFTCLLGRA